MIPIEDDSVAENTEQFFVMLGSTDDAVIIGTNLATVVILDISGTYTCNYTFVLILIGHVYNYCETEVPASFVFLSIGVLVSFAEATYLADEDQGTVEVCLSLAGQLDRNLNVTISTVSGSATGSYIIAQFSMSMHSLFVIIVITDP